MLMSIKLSQNGIYDSQSQNHINKDYTNYKNGEKNVGDYYANQYYLSRHKTESVLIVVRICALTANYEHNLNLTMNNLWLSGKS